MRSADAKSPRVDLGLVTTLLLVVGIAGLVALLVPALGGLPDFGDVPHPYGQRAVAAALDQQTANAVASVTFDQRGSDTLGEEFMLFAAAVGALLLLRRLRTEDEQAGASHSLGPEDVFEAVRLVGYVLLPLTVLIGAYIVLHGHISPGGGFQGGVVLATGIHVAYLAGDMPALDRLRSENLFEVTEALGAAAFVTIGLSVLASGAAFLENVLPKGSVSDLLSAGTVPVLNVAVGVEVGSALVLMLARFLEQALLIRQSGEED
jgi:multicomponent Na+:H+ antiporter subunit B